MGTHERKRNRSRGTGGGAEKNIQLQGKEEEGKQRDRIGKEGRRGGRGGRKGKKRKGRGEDRWDGKGGGREWERRAVGMGEGGRG